MAGFQVSTEGMIVNPPWNFSGSRVVELLMSEHKSTTPWWVCLIVVIGSVLLIAGGIIALVNPAMLVGRGEEINTAARVYAGYVVSRDIAIGGMLLGSLIVRARSALNAMMMLTALVQVVDVGIDCMEGRWSLVPGVLVLGVAFLFATISGLRKQRSDGDLRDIQ
jgi:hypothetical protein